MKEELTNLILENLVSRRSGQFQLLADMVRTPSVIYSAGMAGISEQVFHALKELELGVERHTVTPDPASGLSEVTNLVVRHEFASGPVVALVAHGDTRPATGTWSHDPMDPQIRNGVLYGLGVLGKADIVAYAHALVALRDARPELSGTVELHFTFDGEADGTWGTKWLLDNGVVNPDYALGSGNTYGIGTSSVGDLQMQVDVESLGASPSADPMQAASRILDGLYQLRTTYVDIQSDVPGIGSPSLVVGQIHGGDRPDQVPGRVSFSLDRRLLPDEIPAKVEENLTRFIAEAASRLDGIVCRIRRVKLAPPMKPGPGTDHLAGVFENRASAVMGVPVPVYGLPYATVTRHYTAVGIPSILYGAGPECTDWAAPGGALPGGPDECLVLDDLRKATETVALALGDFMTPAG